MLHLQCERLECREVPALTIDFDYRFDTSGFFNDPALRAVLDRAGADLASRISSTPPALLASGTNTWTALLFNPATGGQTSVRNLAVPEGHMVVFVAGRDLDGREAGSGGSGGYTGDGDPAWLATVPRGWGGSIAFDSDLTWNTGASDAPAGQTSLYTVATHELGHVLGIGTSQAWNSLVVGQSFGGTHTGTLYGSAPRLSADLAHLAAGVTYNGGPVSMGPYLQGNKHYGFTDLDYALLADLGWSITPKVATAAITATVTTPVTDSLRSVVADINGDGVKDVVTVSDVGGGWLRIVDGKTNKDLVPVMPVFGDFTGGLFVATADIDRDGRSEVIVSPDAGGGGRISVFRYRTSFQRVGDFFGIDDVTFRGGARVAAADINGDGTPDIIVGAGLGGGPRIALFDGTSITVAKPRKLVGDFFAFPGEEIHTLRNGVYVAAADFNGDGKAEIIFGAGPGGGPRVVVIDGAAILRNDRVVLADYFAFDANNRGGVAVRVSGTRIIATSDTFQISTRSWTI